MVKFDRVYIEVTQKCGLSCSFCPSDPRHQGVLSLENFHKICEQLQGITKKLVFHVMGDPLTLPSLNDYLDMAYKWRFEVMITTAGVYLSSFSTLLATHKALSQVNISLHAYTGGSINKTPEEYLVPIIAFCDEVLEKNPTLFVNLRLWQEKNGENDSFYTVLSQLLTQKYEFSLIPLLNNHEKNRYCIKKRILLNFELPFEWPSLKGKFIGDKGRCFGLKSHIAILNDGRVVPCCLDYEGVITLGSIFSHNIESIITSSKALLVRNGFRAGKVVEELCQHCHYRLRFS